MKRRGFLGRNLAALGVFLLPSWLWAKTKVVGVPPVGWGSFSGYMIRWDGKIQYIDEYGSPPIDWWSRPQKLVIYFGRCYKYHPEQAKYAGTFATREYVPNGNREFTALGVELHSHNEAVEWLQE